MSMVPSFKNIFFSFNFSFFFNILVIVIGEKWVPCPIRVGEKWLPVQNLAVRSGYPTKTWLSEVVTWPKLVGEIWSPDQYVSVIYVNLFIGQVTISHRRVSVRWPLLTAEFWSGTHFWQPSFGSVTISHRHVLDRVPIFHRRLLREIWNKNYKKLKLKLKEIFLKLGTMLILFLGICYVLYVKIAPTDTILLKSKCLEDFFRYLKY